MGQIKAGTTTDFGDSMTAAMEQAFEKEWQAVKGSLLPSSNREDMRLLFVAIAQGIVKHLKDNAGDSIKVTGGTVTGTNTVTGEKVSIGTTGTLY
jgi:hypothetical protein